jgi:hypothetical protein
MIDTIGQTAKSFNRWIDTFSVKHDRYYRYRTFDGSIKIKLVFLTRSWAFFRRHGKKQRKVGEFFNSFID